MDAPADGTLRHNHRYPAAPYGMMRRGEGTYPDGCRWWSATPCFFDFSTGLVMAAPQVEPSRIAQEFLCQSPEDLERYLGE